MTNIVAVIGSSYGDEGKGLYTSYFADKFQEGYVVRHNSGSQCGHTVQLPDGTRHIFSHFGSGTFQNFPTIWGHRCVANPFAFKTEREELIEKGAQPKLLVHRECMVTTPYDMIVNQIIESIRNNNRHGSCGMGFGETIERHEKKPELSLLVRDLHQPKLSLIKQIKKIRQFYLNWRIKQLFPNIPNSEMNKWIDKFPYHSNELFDDFIEACEYFIEHIQIIKNYSILNNQNIIFESGQGLLLDQHFGSFPYVTRSHTGLKNIAEIIDKLNKVNHIDVNYVSRTYTTRHGNGPLDFEMPTPIQLIGADKTNVTNEFQGQLRYAPLNATKMYNAIQYDLTYLYHAKYPVVSKLAFTWLDFDQTLLVSNGTLLQQTPEEYNKWIISAANYGSNGPTIANIIKYKP